MTSHTPADRPTSSASSLTIVLYLVAGGVLVQAMLAGTFISGVANTRLAHTIVGWLLPYLSLVPAGIAHARRRLLPSPMVGGCVALPVLMWVQEGLGHAPVAATTAVHVPLGVSLFGGALALAVASHRVVLAPDPALGGAGPGARSVGRTALVALVGAFFGFNLGPAFFQESSPDAWGLFALFAAMGAGVAVAAERGMARRRR
jgi:hypothetical protein